MTPRKAQSKKEGGIDLRSELAKISDSQVAGRDHIEGISGKDIGLIIETLLKYFPQGYLKNPGQLDKALSDFRRYHEQLHEYKELHNGINEIMVAFEPFKAEVDHSNSRKLLPRLGYFRNLWRPVSRSVSLLLRWSQTIRYIGKPFREHNDQSRTGEDWAIQFSDLRQQINIHLGLKEYSMEPVVYPRTSQRILYKAFGLEIPWWETLNDLTSSFGHTSSYFMNSADKQLRQTAQELFNLSSKALSS